MIDPMPTPPDEIAGVLAANFRISAYGLLPRPSRHRILAIAVRHFILPNRRKVNNIKPLFRAKRIKRGRRAGVWRD
jgi:hypothetical protein